MTCHPWIFQHPSLRSFSDLIIMLLAIARTSALMELTFSNIQSIFDFPQGSPKCLYNLCFFDPDPKGYTWCLLHPFGPILCLFFMTWTLWMNPGQSYNVPYSGFPDCFLMIKRFEQENYRGDVLSLLTDHIRN